MYIWGDGRAAGRVGSGQTFCRQSRVGSGQRFAGSGRVGSKKSDPWTTLCGGLTPISSPVHSIVIPPTPSPKPHNSCCVADPPSSFFTIRTMMTLSPWRHRVTLYKM